MRRNLSVLVLVSSFVASAFATAQQPERGDLTGKFLLLGEAPAPKPVPAQGPGAPANLVDESLVIGPDQGIADVVIYLQPTRGAASPAAPPAGAALPVTIAVANSRLDPHVAVVEVGQRLTLVNRDRVGCNLNSQFIANSPFSVLLSPNATIDMQFPSAESLPSQVSDSIHPWISGRLLVAPTSFNAVTDANGDFTIRDLPVGTWKFRVWHERAGYVEKATIGDEAVGWPKGVLEMEIKEGNNDLGQIMVSAAEFE